MIMRKLKAVFLDKASLYPDDLDFSVLEKAACWQWFDNINTDDIPDILEDAEVLVTNKVLLSRALIENCRQLKLICIAATGVNNVDLAAARQHEIPVCNVRAYATSSVVQHVFSFILALNRKLLPYRKSVLEGDWSRSDFFCYFDESISGLEGKTLGVIGYGELGQAVAKLARCFGMEVLIARSHSAEKELATSRVDLKILLARSDVVSLHCPLSENNRHMIGGKELTLMKPEAILVNTARGGLIDEAALLHALEKKQIGGAALDVLEEEPPSINNALINYRADNLVITPHIAWASQGSRQRLIDEIAENIRAFQQGVPRNIV